VIALRLDTKTMTATLASSFVHPGKPLVVPSQGDFQPLPDGSWFVGWGQEPYLSEYSATGGVLFDAHMPKTYQSYTTFKYPWVGSPSTTPSIALSRGSRGQVLVHASWNGSTATASWRVVGGSDAAALAALKTVPRSGFETTIAISSAPHVLAVQALGAQGQVLGTTRALVAPHG
jgi:hypothetical protein